MPYPRIIFDIFSCFSLISPIYFKPYNKNKIIKNLVVLIRVVYSLFKYSMFLYVFSFGDISTTIFIREYKSNHSIP